MVQLSVPSHIHAATSRLSHSGPTADPLSHPMVEPRFRKFLIDLLTWIDEACVSSGDIRAHIQETLCAELLPRHHSCNRLSASIQETLNVEPKTKDADRSVEWYPPPPPEACRGQKRKSEDEASKPCKSSHCGSVERPSRQLGVLWRE